jgi:hypothetical protein
MRIVTISRTAPTTTRPFPVGFWNADLPDNATVDMAHTAAIQAELVSESHAAAPNLNATTFTAEITVVPADQPLIPVTNTYTGGGSQVDWCKLGVPIPAGWKPTPDKLANGHPGDCTGIFYQPDYVSPYDASIQGRVYELWRMIQAADGSWSCQYAHRDVGVNTSSEVWSRTWVSGPGGSYKTDSDSTYVDGYWTTGAGIALAPTLLTPADVQRGYADHRLGLLVMYSSSPNVWPASKTDADSSTSPLHEGMTLRLPPGYQIPAGLHPIAKCVAQTAIRKGLVIVDQAGCLVIRATPSVKAAGYLNGTPEYQIFNGFPWGDLVPMVAGTQANPIPLS